MAYPRRKLPVDRVTVSHRLARTGDPAAGVIVVPPHFLDEIVTRDKVLENPIVPHDGRIRVPELPGLGLQIKPEVWTHPAAITRTTTA